MKNNMRIVDIDMDYFLKEIPIIISENNTDRLPDEDYQVWSKDEVIDFLENKLGLSKETKIKGKIVTHHNEALYYWRKLIQEERLSIPFEVVHIDSHADLGLGYPSWTFIIDSLITVPVEERTKIENYGNMFEKYYEPRIGDYLLFALAFRWIKKLVYVCNPADIGNDYVWMILKDGMEPNDKIQLVHNEEMKAIEIASNTERYYATEKREPEVDFEIVRCAENISYNGEFDYLTFCVSPNYTPTAADFIIELMKEYIEGE